VARARQVISENDKTPCPHLAYPQADPRNRASCDRPVNILSTRPVTTQRSSHHDRGNTEQKTIVRQRKIVVDHAAEVRDIGAHVARVRGGGCLAGAHNGGCLKVEAPVIDLHSHVLPGIDDGPDSIEGSLELARAAAAAGTRTLLATPHVSFSYPNEAGAIARLVEELNERLHTEQIALEVRPGAEIAMTRLADITPEELARLGLGGGRWLLVEPPFTPVLTGLDSILLDLQRRGHRILLAHPERCHAFHRDPEMLEGLVRSGVLTSVTAGSLVGQFGGDVRRFALGLARDGLIHNVASDAHDHVQRRPSIAAELEQAGLAPLADWLTREIPAAILADREIPPRPAVDLPAIEKPSRRAWRRR
jgi:protein-tyrosine phosphatase